MKTFYLEPNKGQKSFYGKATVIIKNNVAKLKSYDTIVCEYDMNNNKMLVFGWYSNTTAKHINAFLNYYGFDTCTKKELLTYNDKQNENF